MRFTEEKTLINIIDLSTRIKGNILTSDIKKIIQISGGYSCDMISWVISRIGNNEAWITILNSRNVVAAAYLSECKLIILSDSVSMDADVLKLAEEHDIVVISTPFNSYQTSVILNEFIHED